MIQPISLTAAEQMTDSAFRRTLAVKFNELAQAINSGVVWENKVSADYDHITTLASVTDTEFRRIQNEFSKVTGGKL